MHRPGFAINRLQSGLDSSEALRWRPAMNLHLPGWRAIIRRPCRRWCRVQPGRVRQRDSGCAGESPTARVGRASRHRSAGWLPHVIQQTRCPGDLITPTAPLSRALWGPCCNARRPHPRQRHDPWGRRDPGDECGPRGLGRWGLCGGGRR